MRRRIIAAVVGVVVLVLLLAFLSQRATYRRLFGVYPATPAELHLQAVDPTGEPVPQATLHILRDGESALNFPIVEHDSPAGLMSDDAGRWLLHQETTFVEWEEWRLFWLIRQDDGGPPLIEIELRAPGYQPVREPLWVLVSEGEVVGVTAAESGGGEEEIPIIEVTIVLQPVVEP